MRLEMLASLRRQNSVSQAYGCFLWEGSATRQLAFRCRDFGKRRWSWPLYSISLNRSLEAERGPLVGSDHRQIHKARDAEPARQTAFDRSDDDGRSDSPTLWSPNCGSQRRARKANGIGQTAIPAVIGRPRLLRAALDEFGGQGGFETKGYLGQTGKDSIVVDDGANVSHNQPAPVVKIDDQTDLALIK